MHLRDELHFYDDREPKSAAVNMAIDEALLESVAAPSLRIYGWKRPSLSFGYFGLFDEVAPEMSHRDVVRRWTGGGIVFHGNDLTYSLILPANGVDHFPAARAIYRHVHDAIRRALGSHLPVELAAEDAPRISAACFANPVVADVLSNGKKIAGAAQRRTRAGLLQQGSVQHPDLPASFAESFARALCPHFTRAQLSSEVKDRALDLAAQRYGTEAWLRRR